MVYRGKVREAPKSQGRIDLGSQMSVQNFTAIHQIVAEVFQTEVVE